MAHVRVRASRANGPAHTHRQSEPTCELVKPEEQLRQQQSPTYGVRGGRVGRPVGLAHDPHHHTITHAHHHHHTHTHNHHHTPSHTHTHTPRWDGACRLWGTRCTHTHTPSHTDERGCEKSRSRCASGSGGLLRWATAAATATATTTANSSDCFCIFPRQRERETERDRERQREREDRVRQMSGSCGSERVEKTWRCRKFFVSSPPSSSRLHAPTSRPAPAARPG